MTLDAQAVAPAGALLTQTQIDDTLHAALAGKFTGARVLVLIPDHTRSVPLPQLFRLLVETLRTVKQLDFMVALGTHPALSADALNRLVGITAEERATTYAHVGLLNHEWDNPNALAQIGTLTREQIQQIAGERWHPSLGGDVPVRINRRIFDYDHILILGPVFPHEVVGISGGAKYLFPGISGPDMINVTHWLGALITVLDTIGVKDTPVRAMINAAAALVSVPITLAALTVEKGELSGMFIGDHLSAWSAAADHSSQRHIIWVNQLYQRVLSHAPPMYDELWVGAKAMYKLDPAIADGGEVIVYAPHLEVVSHVHGANIYKVGYHVRDYFLKQWERFSDIPLGVIAHSTHLRGSGAFSDGVEYPRIKVTLASRIPPEDCARLSLGYMNPDDIRIEDWRGRESEGLLYVPKAGEMLYRVKPR
ncbi:MAG: lactate racemase domain-containing protein [Chloroflexota bacterium]|nr:lactate racemase domain-containing protein [Chloroflexota bacterium]